jgi:AcrR family transcriptional regulator
MANLVPKTPPTTWLTTARTVLIDEGIQGVKVDRLALKLGVTKGGFYKHFADRADLLVQLRVLWERENIFVLPMRPPTNPAKARDRVLALTRRLIDEDGYDPRFDLAVRDWARVDPDTARCVARVDRQRLGHLKGLFAGLGCDSQEADVRARVLYYHQIGYYALGITERKEERLRLLPAYLQILVGADRLQVD